MIVSLNGCIRLGTDHVKLIPIHHLHPVDWKTKKQENVEHFKMIE